MIVFACMVFLASRQTEEPRSAPEQQPTRQPDWEETLPQRIDAVTEALQGTSLALSAPVEERKGSGALRWIHRRYDVAAPHDQEEKAQESLDSLRLVDPGVTVRSVPRFDGVDVQVGLDGLLTHTVRFRWEDQEKRPRVALVIAPLGDDLRVARDCMSIDAPIAIAVRPFRPFSKEVAERGRLFDREILVYVNLPGEGERSGGEDGGLAADLKRALDSVPNAVGVTGDDGGPLDPELTEKIRQEANRLGLFYVRSQPAGEEATGPAVVVLNSEQLTEPLADQFAKLIAKARALGAVVAVAQPSQEILSMLPEHLTEWQASGVEVVPVSKLAAPAGLSAG